MDQPFSLADLLIKPSSFGGAAAVCTPDSDATQEDFFSSLVSETGALQIPAAPQIQETTVSAATASPAPAPLSLPTAEAEDVLVEASFDEAEQSAADLAAALCDLLAALRFGNADVTAVESQTTEKAGAVEVSSAKTQDVEAVSLTLDEAEQLWSSLSSLIDDLAETAQVVADSDSSSAAKHFSDVIAELLALMQLVVRTLQQTALTNGGTDVSGTNDASVAEALADATNALVAGADLGSSNPDVPELFSPRPTEGSSLLDLLETAEENAKGVLENLTRAFLADVASEAATVEATTAQVDAEAVVSDAPAGSLAETVVFDTAVSTLTPVATDATPAEAAATLARLETEIQAALVYLRQKIQASSANTEDASLPHALAVTPTFANAPLSEAAQGTVWPFREAETAAQVSIPLVAAASKTAESVVAEKPNATIKTEVSAESKKEALSSLASDVVLIKALSGDLGNESPSLESDGFENGNGKSFLPSADATSALSFTAEGAQAKGIYSFASTLSAFRAANGGTKGLPTLVDQVILHMNRNVKNGQNQMSLQLQPSDLGKISVKIDFGSDGKVQGSVVADNPRTLEMLQKDSRSLERALQDAGLRAEPGSLEFSLGGQERQNGAGQTASSAGNNSGNAADNGAESAEIEGLELVDPAAVSETYYITPTSVNIRV